MWWILVLAALGLIYLWPTPSRRIKKHLSAAMRASETRNWAEFQRQAELARPHADKLPPGPIREQFLGEIELAAAKAAYWRGELECVSTSLSKAIEHIERDGASDREARISAARHLWGDTEFDRGAFAAAAEQFRMAAQTVEFGKNPALAILSLQRLGDALLLQEKYNDAREVIERCVEFERRIFLDIAEENGGVAQPQIPMCMPDLALASRDFARAEELFQEKADEWAEVPQRPLEIDVTRCQFHLATAQRRQGKFEGAVRTLENAVRIAESEFGTDHPRTSLARKRLAEAAKLRPLSLRP